MRFERYFATWKHHASIASSSPKQISDEGCLLKHSRCTRPAHVSTIRRRFYCLSAASPILVCIAGNCIAQQKHNGANVLVCRRRFADYPAWTPNGTQAARPPVTCVPRRSLLLHPRNINAGAYWSAQGDDQILELKVCTPVVMLAVELLNEAFPDAKVRRSCRLDVSEYWFRQSRS